MRKVLTAVIRDTTPPPGMRHPLTDETIQDMRVCLGLITAREKELSEEAGETQARPFFVDEQPTSTVVPFDTPKKTDKE
ncbi:MAG: segregation and condensation protein A [Sedimenticola sp.]|nr:segregation and condensation protein A [Sedimenticola sp.]